MNLEKIRQDLLCELGIVLGYDVGLDDNLLVEGGLDSFGIMQVIAYLEDGYGVMIPVENFETINFGSARKISDLISKFRDSAG